MFDATEWILGALVIVLGGAAFAVAGQVIRDAWRGGFKGLRKPSGSTPGSGGVADTAPRTRRPARGGDDHR